ncbi:MAG: hypothetical protein ABIR06_21425 [Cyclobacteriaceae bacterium]
MVKVLTVIAALMALNTSAVYSQADSTQYIFGLPVTKDDTARRSLEQDVEPKNNLEIVSIGKLPNRVRKVLDKEAQYKGWQDSLIYFNTNTRLFVVPVKNGNTIKIYGLNENGRPVTFSEVTRSGAP